MKNKIFATVFYVSLLVISILVGFAEPGSVRECEHTEYYTEFPECEYNYTCPIDMRMVACNFTNLVSVHPWIITLLFGGWLSIGILSIWIQDKPFDHIWYWKSRLPERKGQACRVLVRGKMNTILVEFEDGYKVTTSRFAVRKQKTPQENEQ